jgi:5,10-methylenetetrahydromethanopterin reductase
MVNAAAIATLAGLAPGRTVVAIGSGFTGRMTMGQRSLRWSFVRRYLAVLRALLRGEEVEWEGAAIKMIHPDGFAPSRPIDVPLLVAADGPKGLAVARELGDGVFRASGPVPAEDRADFRWVAQLTSGTVLDEGEDPGSERAMAAAGHAVAVAFHARYERGGIDALPRGREWAERIEAIPERTRHLAIHEGHLVAPSPIDRPFIDGDLMRRLGRAMPAGDWQSWLSRMDEGGITEVAYQPAGPDIPRELTAFARMAGLTGS